ncbi:MAG TPA: nucleotidyltransferase domain-containing protein [Thermoanaerobaculia bacterium]|nr:nucleotidyltransferase domain-containing protein [Thermoanaerobaculia bacterium]
MTDESRARLEAARDLAREWTADPRVRAVAAGGSVAAGTADRWSDIDLYVYWDPCPDPTPRDLENEHEIRIDQTAAGEVSVEVSHFPLARVEAMFEAVLVRCDADPRKQDLVSSVATGIPLYGEALLRAYAARAAQYPDGLARNMVLRHLDFTAESYLQVLAARNDVVRLHDLLVRDARSILGMLLGINRVYQPHPRFKCMPALVRLLTITPPRLEQRLGAMLGSAPAGAVMVREELLAEVLALTRIHMPEIDAAAHSELP